MEFTKTRIRHLKTPKESIGFVDVFSPGPAGDPLLPKSIKSIPIQPKCMWNVDKSTEMHVSIAVLLIFENEKM